MYLQLADSPAYLGQASPDLLEYMVAIPNQDGGMSWVREDMLDDVPDEVLYQILQSQPHMAGIKDWFGRMRERRQQRKTERRDFKTTKLQMRQERQAQRQQAFGGIIGKVTDAIGGRQAPMEPAYGTRGVTDLFPQITGGANIGVSQWWQNPAVLIGGAVVVLGGIYLLTKKK